MNADTRPVLDAVRVIVQALRRSSALAERHAGLSSARLFVLKTLGEAPAMSLNELAERTHTHQSSVSVVISRLAADGLVRRTRSRTDRRALELSLTPRGARLAAGAPDLAQARLVEAIAGLPPRRRRLLASSLTEVARALDTPGEAPAMFFEPAPRRRAGGARG